MQQQGQLPEEGRGVPDVQEGLQTVGYAPVAADEEVAQPHRQAVADAEEKREAALGALPDAVEAVSPVRFGQHVVEADL